MNGANDVQSGPCVVCGATNYSLSYGGPTICPACDCGASPPQAIVNLSLRNTMLRNSLDKSADREKRLEDALHRIYDCLESDIRVLARNKTLCHHLGVYKKAVKRALLAEREKQP